MRFVYEKITQDYLVRRVKHESLVNRRRVREVVLAPGEWAEFKESHPRSIMAHEDCIELLIDDPTSPTNPTENWSGYWRVTVRPEFR